MKKLFIVFIVLCLFPLNISADPWAQGFPYTDYEEESKVNTFSDVLEEHQWAKDAIDYFSENNIVEGNDDGLFMPDENVTREQLAKIIALFFELPETYPTDDSFSDVDADMWSYEYIENARTVLTGFKARGDDEKPFFKPLSNAVREDVFVAIVKAMGQTEDNAANLAVLRQIRDEQEITPSLKSYIAIAVERGIAIGYDRYLRPQDNMTRAELVSLLYRTLKIEIN